MKVRAMSILPDKHIQNILLIGDISRAFSNTVSIGEYGFEIRANMLDGIETAARNGFSVIYVMISAVPSRLKSALKALREVSGKSKIILLAQMYEEETASRLVGSGSDGVKIADDYLICPLGINQLHGQVETSHGPGQPMQSVTVGVDHFADARLKELEKLATTDELTGLKNRRYIWEFARQIINYAAKEGRRVTLLLYDIDDFKHYNDVCGHPIGDEILKQAAVLMQRSCRPHDIVGRVGGDEFAVIFWDDPKRIANGQTESERRSAMADHPREAIFIAKRFRMELSKADLHLLGAEGEGVLTISGGLASFPRDGSTVQELFNRADEALLDAKRSGKNRIYLVGKAKSDIEDIK